MRSHFMFLFLTFFLIVTCCTFESESPIEGEVEGLEAIPLATISKVEPQLQLEESPQVVEEVPYSEFSTEIQFKEGKLSISRAARKEIKELFERARREGRIRAAKIITWADQDLPKLTQKSLSSVQRKLAEDRNDKIEAILENLDLRMNVAKISMAERPEVMDDILSGEDKEIRKSFAELPHSNLSKSIVMFLLKEK